MIDSEVNTITGNTIHDNSAYGIFVSHSDSNHLNDNTCYTGSFGIYLDNANNNVVINSMCYSFFYGIRLYNSDSNFLANNTCHSNVIHLTMVS